MRCKVSSDNSQWIAGREIKLPNRRVAVVKLTNRYYIEMKMLTDDKRVKVTKFFLTPQAAEALRVLLNELEVKP